jgi:hypothetical protein
MTPPDLHLGSGSESAIGLGQCTTRSPARQLSDGVTPVNRSSEELRMRELIVPELRKRCPSARIIHELPLRYSERRIDLAAVTESEIISVEIKSSKDVADRLEAQLRGFLPISSQVIVALAPKWNEKLPSIERKRKDYTSYSPQYTEAQEIINRVGWHPFVEVWTVDADAGTIHITDRAHRKQQPWASRLLDILHVSELVSIAGKHRCWQGKRPRHTDLVTACVELMTGREIVAAVCGALRNRSAFGRDSDPPIAAMAS